MTALHPGDSRTARSVSYTHLFNGDYPTALDDYEEGFLNSLTPEDRVTLPGYNGKKTMYEGTEYTMMQKPFGEHASQEPTDVYKRQIPFRCSYW